MSEPAGTGGELESYMHTLERLPPEQFKLAMKTVEAQLARDHELRMERERNGLLDAANARSHALFAWGLGTGFVIVLGMITASVVVGLQGYVWLSALLSGPGVAVLASLFVLRRLDSRALRQMTSTPPDEAPAGQPPGTL
jgi:hypothetical protein